MSSLIKAQASPLVRSGASVSRQAIFKPVTAVAPSIRANAVNAFDLNRLHARRASVVALAKKGGKGGKGGDSDSDDKKGGKGGKGGDKGGDVDVAKVEKEAKADAEDRMKKCLAALTDNFNTIRTGRASPAILDRVMVEQYGSPVPLKSVASVSVPDASTLMISPFDKKALKDIEKALLESDIGINPSNDGEKIRLAVPPLTQERRKELSKAVSKFAEDGKVALRNVRKDVMKKIDKVDGFSKDAKKDLEDAIQKLTDANVKKVDEMAKAKTDEVMKL